MSAKNYMICLELLRIQIFFCGGLTLSGCRMPTKATRSLPAGWAGKWNRMKIQREFFYSLIFSVCDLGRLFKAVSRNKKQILLPSLGNRSGTLREGLRRERPLRWLNTNAKLSVRKAQPWQAAPCLSQPQAFGRVTAPQSPRRAPSPAWLPAAVAVATAPSWRAPGGAQPLARRRSAGAAGEGRSGAGAVPVPGSVAAWGVLPGRWTSSRRQRR